MSGEGGCAFGDPYCPCQDGDACHYVDVPGSPAMTPPGEQRDSGVDLSTVELVVLARHLAGQHIREHAMWLDWGDVPELAESTFERLCEAMQTLGNHLVDTACTFGYDGSHLHKRATIAAPLPGDGPSGTREER